MKILRLYIQGCGVFNRTLIDFTHDGKPQNMLCLAGVNGSGKTTVMELLFNLVTLLNPDPSNGIFFDRIKPHIFTRTEFAQLDVLIEDGKLLSLVVGPESNKVSNESNPQTQEFIIEPELSSLISTVENTIVKIPENENEANLIKTIRKIKSSEELLSKDRVRQEPKEPFFQLLLQKIKTGLSDENLTQTEGLPSVYFFNAHDREILDIRYTSIPREKPKYQVTHRYNPKTDDLKKTLIYYDYAYPQKFAELQQWINQHVLVDKEIKEVDRPNFNVIIQTKSGKKHGLEQLSSGEESLLILATQVYLNASNSTVIIIDEVDQSLHPEFQEKVMTLLFQLQKDKGCQMIVSSHSEVIWNFFKPRGFIDLTEVVM